MAQSDAKRTGPIEFLKQTRVELSKVTWPTRKETTVSTIMVFVMVTICSIFLFLADQIIMLIIKFILS